MEPGLDPKGLGMKGRRWLTLVGAMLSSAAVIAVAAVPASANVPGGQGLGIFGTFDCGDSSMLRFTEHPPCKPPTPT